MKHHNNQQSQEDQESYSLYDILREWYSEEEFSEEERETLINETAAMVSEMALLKSINEAGEAAQNAFNELMEKNPDPKEVEAFIDCYLPSYHSTLAQELENFFKPEEEDSNDEVKKQAKED